MQFLIVLLLAMLVFGVSPVFGVIGIIIAIILAISFFNSDEGKLILLFVGGIILYFIISRYG